MTWNPGFQTTIADVIELTGIGLHTGQASRVTLHPTKPDYGVRFLIASAPGSVLTIPAISQQVSDLRLSTCLLQAQCEIRSIEHLLSAVHGLGLDNVAVKLDGPEIPILDGSALPFVEKILQCGIVIQDQPRRCFCITAPFEIQRQQSRAYITPYDGFQVHYSIEFEHPCIGAQSYCYDWSVDSYCTEIAPARTFGFFSQFECLKQQDLIQGGSLANAVVFTSESILNPPLRFPNEPVRHKILDAIGDLFLLGSRIQASLAIERGGHAFHIAVVNEILTHPDYYTIVSGS